MERLAARWEYKVVKATFGDDLQDTLNRLGYAGWEVISLAGLDGTFTLTGNKLFAVLKRPLPEDAPPPPPPANVAGWI